MLNKDFPTNLDLLKGDIVSINLCHKKIITSSLQVAKYFNKRPADVNRRIRNLIKKGLCKITPSDYLNQQRKTQKYYELNRDQFMLVALGFNGDKAEQFKVEIIERFNKLESELIEWRKGRLTASDSTKTANKELQWLQNELTIVIPNSKRCTMLYSHFQIAINKIVTGKGVKVDRDTLSNSEINQIIQLEALVQTEISVRKKGGIAPEKIRDDVLEIVRKTEPSRRAVLT